MKKKTISAILIAFNICMVIAIIILVMKINARGPKPEEDLAALPDIHEETLSSSANNVNEDEAGTMAIGEKLVIIPDTTTSVNVRSGPGTDYKRVGSAYADCEYEVIEIYNADWTKIDYDGEYGYINSDYFYYQYKTEFADGTVSYMDVPEEDLEKYKKENASDKYINTDAIENNSEDADNSEENLEEQPQ